MRSGERVGKKLVDWWSIFKFDPNCIFVFVYLYLWRREGTDGKKLADWWVVGDPRWEP